MENGNITITQQFSDEEGNKIPTPDFWKNIQEVQVITGVDKVLFGYIKSPINNRKAVDNYGVPITYGCDSTILEIKDTMKQLYREYKLKEAFVGADSTMFDGKDALPKNGLFKKIDSGDDTFFEVFDPAFRPFTDRLLLTEINDSDQEADVFFPEITNDWEKTIIQSNYDISISIFFIANIIFNHI